VIKDLDRVLEVIVYALTPASPGGDWLRADQVSVGCLLVSDETGATEAVETVESEFGNETLFSLSVADDHSFITQCGVARG
jgi:hypothetical protein